MKSKINIKSIIILAIIGIISLFFINMSLATSTGKITVETANLRETADENSKILELLSMSEEVEVIEKVNNWYKVKAKGITGYLREDLLDVVGNVAQQNDVNTNQTTTENNTNNEEQTIPNNEVTTETEQNENIELGKNVVKENIKLKIVPIINATDIAEIKKDEEVNVIEIVNNWVCIETSTAKGWVRKEKLQKKKDSETTQDTNSNDTTTAQTTQEINENNTQTQTAQGTNENNAQTQTTQDTTKQETTPNTTTAQTTEANTTSTNVVNKTLYVKETSVNLRQEANTTSGIISILSVNTQVNVTEEKDGWSKVKVNGTEGYILSSLLSDQKQATSRSQTTSRQNNQTQETTKTQNVTQETQNKTEKTSTANNNASQTTQKSNNTATNTTSSKGSSVAETAKKYIGYKYVWGGTSPSTGFDCSGFAQYIYKQYGVNLNRTAAAQTGNGTAVSKSNLQPGDLVFFGKSGISHVGIYVGGGQMVHASNSTRGVRTDTITSGYYNNNYSCARRIF